MKRYIFNLQILFMGISLIALLWPRGVAAQEPVPTGYTEWNSGPNPPAISLSYPTDPNADGMVQTPDGLWRSTGISALQAQADTPATIFHTSQVKAGVPSIRTSWDGYGNASQAVLPETTGVNGYVQASPLVGAAPGGRSTTTINYGSSGVQVMDGSVLTVTLDSALTYVEASPPPQNISNAGGASATTLTWNLPSLRFLGYGRLLITTEVPSTTIGSTYPMQVMLTTPGDENVADNSFVIQVMEALQVFLGSIMR